MGYNGLRFDYRCPYQRRAQTSCGNHSAIARLDEMARRTLVEAIVGQTAAVGDIDLVRRLDVGAGTQS